jgi:hypothetical protein
MAPKVLANFLYMPLNWTTQYVVHLWATPAKAFIRLYLDGPDFKQLTCLEHFIFLHALQLIYIKDKKVNYPTIFF